MRRRFGRILAELADIDQRIVISGDIGYRVFDEFREDILIALSILAFVNRV